MKVLALAPYCYPESISSTHLDENLNEAYSQAGIVREIYAPYPCRGIDQATREKYKKIRYEERYNGYQQIHRFPLYKEGVGVFSRALRYIICMFLHFYYGVKSKDIDVMLSGSTPPTQGLLFGVLKAIKKVPFVYALQDIFPDSLVSTGITRRGSVLWKIGRVIENFTYRNADKIIVISEDFKRNIMAKGVPEEKIVVIYNWVDEEAVVDVPREENKLFDKYGLDRSKFYVTYNGNIGLTQNMDMLLEVAKELSPTPALPRREGESSPTPKHSPVGRGISPSDGSDGDAHRLRDIHFVLVGEGAYKAEVEKRIKEQGITNVTLLPFQPYEDISHVFSLGDVSLVISKPGVGANSVPSKTWSIMSASRPVLANFDENELKTIIEDHHCGIFTKAGDKEAFKAAILNLYHHPELCKEYGRNGRRFVMENLTKEVGTRKYVEVIRAFERSL
jgi:glycosyltransferase involved in cell wall biosynthesis